ncbi:HoxN/HupN/NixA family nickel/cobalt transporter [Scandinavium sp. NPDC088450]|uniref:HoxN/HupN/NixA family nickel/cobalt transporter n=1 Tax=Scandinavium sp. NPDC088450 TaxID=3364514 RepID=UPI00384B655A
MKTLRVRQPPQVAWLVSALVLANVVGWGWAVYAFSDNSTLMASALLAWTYGLRHAVDADHIAAIDTVTRKMLQQNSHPFDIGVWFSFGHSSIVILATLAIAIAATAFQEKMSGLHEFGGTIGTIVSASFLLLLAFINLMILRNVWRNFRKVKQGQAFASSEAMPVSGGIMARLVGGSFKLVNKSWHMYLVGFLFGLGFDTATEVGLLAMSATGASAGISIWSILIFPALFTSGMALVDTLDNVLMIHAYGWAFNKPQRKLYYNMTMTGISVIIALFIGGLEALGLVVAKLNLEGSFWEAINRASNHLGHAGFWVIGIFVVCWVISVLNYRWRKYDALPVN